MCGPTAAFEKETEEQSNIYEDADTVTFRTLLKTNMPSQARTLVNPKQSKVKFVQENGLSIVTLFVFLFKICPRHWFY